MNQTAIFWPMLAHVALVYIMYALISVRRSRAVRDGRIKVSQFRENQTEPNESLFAKNNLANQFELPVLFHVCCLSLYVVGGATASAVLVAWLFVISRYVHGYIHVTSNRIRYRQPAFTAGFLLLAVMWAMLAWRLLAA